MKFADYPADTVIAAGDIFLKDGATGTKKVVGSDLPYAIFDGVPMMHNNIYRGAALGSTFTAAQKAAVSSGTFTGLWIGDYWTFSGVNWRIVDFNTYNYQTTVPHITLMPDTPINNSAMHSSLPSNGVQGLKNSALWGKIDTYSTPFNAAFGDDHSLSVKQVITNNWGKVENEGITYGYGNNGYLIIAKPLGIPSEFQIRGSNSRSVPVTGATGYNSTSLRQFSLFNMGYSLGSSSFWLSDQTWQTYFSSYLSTLPGITDQVVTTSNGVRPFYVLR